MQWPRFTSGALRIANFANCFPSSSKCDGYKALSRPLETHVMSLMVSTIWDPFHSVCINENPSDIKGHFLSPLAINIRLGHYCAHFTAVKLSWYGYSLWHPFIIGSINKTKNMCMNPIIWFDYFQDDVPGTVNGLMPVNDWMHSKTHKKPITAYSIRIIWYWGYLMPHGVTSGFYQQFSPL